MNLPNKITLTRIVMIPIFAFFFYFSMIPYHELIAAGIFVLAALTDALDGYIARSQNLVTNMGKFLDPIADKVLVSTAFVLLLTRPAVFEYGYLSSWGLVTAGICISLILARELIIGGFRLVAVEKRAVIAADKLGKIKTTIQDITIVILLSTMPFLTGGSVLKEVICGIGMGLLLLATILTVVSGTNYILKNRQVLYEEKEEKN